MVLNQPELLKEARDHRDARTPPDELPHALSQGLEQWLKGQPGIRIRSTLPIIKDGNTIGIHVWFDAD